MLKTKSILAPMEKSDGLRVSVMSRHTLNDGVTPDGRITPDLYDKRWAVFAPPLRLIGAYYKANLPWKEFERGYRDYLDSVYQEVSGLAIDSLRRDITIMCIEDSPEKCHRRLLAEKCKEINSNIEILIR